ncbi:MAG: 30S ribosome-binding factor RbfA [Gemmatimonadota bacterium]
MGNRLLRLNEQLKREISEILRTRVRDPRVGVVTVTGVEVTRDLSVARVYVRTLGDKAQRAETLAGVKAAAPFIRTLLGQRLHVRKIPELRFSEDRSLDHAQRIESILHEVLPEGASEGGAGEEGEGPPPEEGEAEDGAPEFFGGDGAAGASPRDT